MTDPKQETTTPPGPTGKQLSRYDGPRTVDDLAKYALTLAVTTLPDGTQRRNEVLPAAFRGNPAGVAFAVEYARALDLSPVTAIIGIHMVDGKPTASAGLISALVRRAGHRIRTWTTGSVTAGDFVATTTIERFDDPGFVYESKWDLPRAVRAGLMRRTDDGRFVSAKDRSAWATYPENMCKARTITEAARDAAEDAILGVHYTPEELGADTDENGDVVYTVTTVPPKPEDMHAAAQEAAERSAAAMRTSAADPEPAAQPEATQEPVGDLSFEDRVEEVRSLILAATTREDLTAAWSRPDLLNGVTAAFKGATVGDERFEEITLYDLFGRAVQAVTNGTAPLLPPDAPVDADGQPILDGDDDDGTVDADVVDEPAADPVDEGAQPDPWPTPPEPTAEQLAKDLAWKSIDEARAGLDSIMAELSPTTRAEAFDWAKAQGLNPTVAAANASAIALAVVRGDAFSDATLAAMAAGDVDDPVALVSRVLGATVVSEQQHTPAQQHEQQIRENSSSRAATARDAAREAARAAARGSK